MSDVYTEYGALIDRFLNGEMSAQEFRSAYLDRFKKEERMLDESLFELLQGLFGDVDVFSTDLALLEQEPELYIDETALRQKAKQALKRLRELQGCGSRTSDHG
jgi:hypothetical protein